jgi:Tol biopolymer transport system component
MTTLDTRARRAAEGIHRAVRLMETSTESPRTIERIERFDRFQERTSRNRRVGAAVVALAMSLALVGGAAVLTSDPSDVVGGRATPSPEVSLNEPDGALVDLRSGETTPLPKGLAVGAATGPVAAYRVSPDGTMLVFQGCCFPPALTYVANVDGTDVRRIATGGLDAFGASWSPDGTQLVYQGRDASTNNLGNLFVVDVATERMRQITDIEPHTKGWWFMWPSFASDGNSILFHQPRRQDDPSDQSWDLWSVPVTGGEPVLVRRNAGFGMYSPDGRTLAYLSPLDPADATGSGLWLVNAGGGDPRQLVDQEGIWWPSWSPDGTRIAYGVGTDEIHVVDVDTGESSRVAAGATAEWFDDHTLIVAPYCCRG